MVLTVTSTRVGDSERAGRQEWLGLALLALPCMLVSLDSSVLTLAVPQLVTELKPSAIQLLWITDSYTFLLAGSLLTMGVLADRYGHRRVLLIGTAGFAVASVAAAAAPGPATLVIARALTGLAGSALMPATLSLIRDMFRRPEQLSVATGIWTASFSLGGLAGPLVGGSLLQHTGWRSVFLVAVPVAVPLLSAGRALLPESSLPDAGRPDLLAAALCLCAVLLTVHGFKVTAQDEAVNRTGVAALLVGGVAATLLVARQRRSRAPLVDPGLLRRPQFLGSVTITAVTFFTLYAHQLLLAQYLQLVLGLSAFTAGLWTLPSVLAFLVGSLLTPVSRRYASAHAVIGGGAVMTCTGFVIMTAVSAHGGLPVYVVGSLVLSAGLGPLYAQATASAVSAAPRPQAGAASAVSETGAELGGALGIAVLGSLASVVYRHHLTARVPADLPTSTVDASRRTLAEALTAAHTLPAGPAASLSDAARQAFVDAFRVVSTISAALLLVAAALVVAVLHRASRADPGSGR